MAYLKHPEHGNKHVPDEEAAALIAEGWVRWPRTKEQKAGIAAKPPDVASAEAAPAKRKYTRKA